VALSVKAMFAVRLPAVLGVKVTLIVHLLPAASELSQVLVSLKSPALVPVIWMSEMLSAALPVFVTVAD